MALSKEITSEIGVVAGYHRIRLLGADADVQKMVIWVSHYVSSEQRDLERCNQLDFLQRERLMSELDSLLMDPTDKNEQERIDLSKKINDLDERLAGSMKDGELVKKCAWESKYNFDFTNDVSFAEAYELLKTLPEYSGAVEV